MAVRSPMGRSHRPVFSGESNFKIRSHTVLPAHCDFVNHFAISGQNEERIWRGYPAQVKAELELSEMLCGDLVVWIVEDHLDLDNCKHHGPHA
jgi:hypothetical protein